MIETIVRQQLTEALRCHNAGQLREAEALYRQVLSYQPANPEALRLLGIALHQTGRGPEAIELIRRAITISPQDPDYHTNLGTVQAAMGRDDEAVSSFRRSLSLRPDHPETLMRLGNTLQHQGAVEEAIAHYRRATALQPDSPEMHYNLGRALHERGQLDETIAEYRQALSLRANFAEAWHNLGAALRSKGPLDEAASALRHAVALRPENGATYPILGAVLSDLGRPEEAIPAFEKAIAMGAATAETYNNLGNALKAKGDFPGALTALHKAIEMRPDLMEAYNNLGITFYPLGRLDEAIAALRKAITLRDDPFVYLNLGNSLRDAGELDEAIACYRKAADHSDLKAASNLLVAIYFHPDYDSRRILDEHKKWAARYAQPLRPFIRPHDNDRSPDRRLRIGYFSHRLGNRPIGRLLLPLLSRHDHEAFEIFCYCDVAQRDYMTDELRKHVDVWRDTGKLSDEAVAELVRKDRIDIFVDLTMHMGGSRLLAFARKPAPVQVTYLAYCGTTGLDTIDYRLTDPYLDQFAICDLRFAIERGRDDISPAHPIGNPQSAIRNSPDVSFIADDRYSERSAYLPRTYWCIAPPKEASEVPAFPRGPSGPITFGCLNSYFKVTTPTLLTWSKLLKRVPQSRLLVHAGEGSHRQRAKDLFAREGVDPDRLQFLGFTPLDAYFQQYQQIDIALDPFPYPGGTTTLDALWMGVPVVTLAGETAHSRGGLSILSNIGLADLVAATQDQYVEVAASLASDVSRLSDLRSTLRARMQSSPLMDASTFAKDVEAALRQMWKSWCQAGS